MAQPSDNLALVQRIEANERAAWRAPYAAVSPMLAAHFGIGYYEHGGALMIWNRAAPATLFNRIIGLGVFEPTTGALLDVLLNRAHAEGIRCLVHVAPDALPHDLAAQLTGRGLTPVANWLVHRRALDGPLPPIVLPPGYRLEYVAAADAPQWSEVPLAAWDFSDRQVTGALALTLPYTNDANTICLSIIHEASERIVAAATLFIHDDVAGLYTDSVRFEHRGRGLHAALIAARLADARARGCTLAICQTLEGHAAQRNMVRAGFEVAYARQNYVMPK
jgi:GNAT superfamily N-acetyltransferase